MSYRWQPRWCVLSKEALIYYSDPDCVNKKGDVPLRGGQIVPFAVSDPPGDATAHRKEHPHGFLIMFDCVGVRKRLFYFDAQSSEYMQAWIKAIEEVIQDLAQEQEERHRKEIKLHIENDTSSDSELEEPPRTHIIGRRYAVSAEACGAWNRRSSCWQKPKLPKSKKEEEYLFQVLNECSFFSKCPKDTLECLVDAMPVKEVEDGTCVIMQGDRGDFGCVIMSGKVDVYDESRNASRCLSTCSSGSLQSENSRFVRTITAGRFFGELSMLWEIPRTRSVYAKGKLVMAVLHRDVYQNLIVRNAIETRLRHEECLRNNRHFETLSDEQIGLLVDASESRVYEPGEVLIQQGDVGDEFMVLLSGQCSAALQTGHVEGNVDIQPCKNYYPGDMFGELCLLRRAPRAATITATSRTEVLCLRRRKFERMLGPLDLLQKQNYLLDPRKSIADFYRDGDLRGPRGACDDKPDPDLLLTEWFAVYRPTIKEAIAKMLNGIAVGKGLNVKGKSAKMNYLKGFVPFMQISNNRHKERIEPSPPDARVKLFFTTKEARHEALKVLAPKLRPEAGLSITTERTINHIDSYEAVFGIDLPEVVLREVYMDSADLVFQVGWETGRESEPAFMNMNLHSVREASTPEVVLYQIDIENPLNPHGLLIAYAENHVKPVVSDFDTFTVGSRGMKYPTPLNQIQASLARWALDRTRQILKTPSERSWNSRWLQVLQEANESGFHPEIPRYGFGDKTSYELIQRVVEATSDSGAVRHGAECFNFWFPQGLDDEFLIVWEGFREVEGKPWKHVDEDDLRQFLIERARCGYAFPLNPVWPVRDQGWYEVFQELRGRNDRADAFDAWFPPESGIVDAIEEMIREFPDGFYKDFQMRDQDDGPRISKMTDLDDSEKADLIQAIARKSFCHMKADDLGVEIMRRYLHFPSDGDPSEGEEEVPGMRQRLGSRWNRGSSRCLRARSSIC